MFDIGFSELLLTAVVALLVLGPDKLPGAARTAGLVIGKLKRSFNEFRREIEREIGADDIRRQLADNPLKKLDRQIRTQLEPQGQMPEQSSSSPQALGAALASKPTDAIDSADTRGDPAANPKGPGEAVAEPSAEPAAIQSRSEP